MPRLEDVPIRVSFGALPEAAAWRHEHASDGFEVAFFAITSDGITAEGSASAVEEGEARWVTYRIELDADWRCRRASVSARSRRGRFSTELSCDGAGHWLVDGERAEHLDGCLDVDLEASAMTNTFPVHRLPLADGQRFDAPAAYVRADDLSVGRLEQSYRRIDDANGASRFDYRSSTFGFRAEIEVDASGLVMDYPGIARRLQ